MIGARNKGDGETHYFLQKRQISSDRIKMKQPQDLSRTDIYEVMFTELVAEIDKA